MNHYRFDVVTESVEVIHFNDHGIFGEPMTTREWNSFFLEIESGEEELDDWEDF